nr:MAG TPA: hypothetical protein [Microviridae sp.]
MRTFKVLLRRIFYNSPRNVPRSEEGFTLLF